MRVVWMCQAGVGVDDVEAEVVLTSGVFTYSLAVARVGGARGRPLPR